MEELKALLQSVDGGLQPVTLVRPYLYTSFLIRVRIFASTLYDSAGLSDHY